MQPPSALTLTRHCILTELLGGPPAIPGISNNSCPLSRCQCTLASEVITMETDNEDFDVAIVGGGAAGCRDDRFPRLRLIGARLAVRYEQ